MAKTRPQKEVMLADYKAELQGINGIIVVTPTGVTPNQINAFKKELGTVGSTYHVVKNTLFSLALDDAKLPKLEVFNGGSNAVIFSTTDIASTAKALTKFMKDNEGKMEIRAGILEGQELSIEQVKQLSDLPSKQQSVAMIAGLLTNPIAGVANVLEDSIRSVAIIINEAFKE
jgi:large subunit ribosomal protein L10